MNLFKIIKEIFTTPYFWLGLILIFAFQVRTYRLDRPIADWHSWRQADTAAVTRNFVKEGFTPFAPKFDDMTPLSEGELPNPNRFRYVEFPAYNILVYPLWLLFPFQEAMARLVSIFLSLGSIVFMFLLVARFAGSILGLLSAFIFAFLPYSIFYSTVIMPEPLLIFSMLATLLFFDVWLEKKRELIKEIPLALLAILFPALSLLTKPTAIFLAIPLFYLAFRHLGFSLFKSPKIWLLVIFTVLPFLLWRFVTLQHPEGVPRFMWLIDGHNLRFKGAFFYWIIQDRLARMILTGAGVALFVLGLLHRTKKEGLFFLSWLLGMVLYVVVFATGNVTHDYYQVALIPILSIYVAKGITFLFLQKGSILERAFYGLVALILLGLTLGLGWREDRLLFNVNNPKIVEVGKLADAVLPTDAKVIAPYGGDTALLYQTNRAGWGGAYLPIAEMRGVGATHYVTVNLNSEAYDVMREYKTLVMEKEYAIFDLREKRSQNQ